MTGRCAIHGANWRIRSASRASGRWAEPAACKRSAEASGIAGEMALGAEAGLRIEDPVTRNRLCPVEGEGRTGDRLTTRQRRGRRRCLRDPGLGSAERNRKTPTQQPEPDDHRAGFAARPFNPAPGIGDKAKAGNALVSLLRAIPPTAAAERVRHRLRFSPRFAAELGDAFDQCAKSRCVRCSSAGRGYARAASPE